MIIPPEVLEWWATSPALKDAWSGVPKGDPYHPNTHESIIDLYIKKSLLGELGMAPVAPEKGVYNKIEVGCGLTPRKYGPHWRYNDVTAHPCVNLHCKASEIDLPDKSVDEIYMFGVFEHFDYKEAEKAIKNFARLLVPGGLLQIDDIPDAFSYVEVFLENMRAGYKPGIPGYNPEYDPAIYSKMNDIQAWTVRAVYGWQRWPGDGHKSYWNYDLLLNVLLESFEVTINIENITSFQTDNKNAIHYHVTAIRRA